ncbi:MAG: hypothetical protein AAGF22_03015, partial [Pseudomonadota bacterium]
MSAMPHPTDPIVLGPDRLVHAGQDASPPLLANPLNRDSFVLDSLADGMAAGRYGGRPLSGNGPAALLAALHAMRWEPDLRSFARAMPHFPTEFGSTELRDVLLRLGFTSSHMQLRGHMLPGAGSTMLVIDPNSGNLLLLGSDASGEPVLRDPESGQARPIKPRRSYEIIAIERAEAEDRTSRSRERWT